jgi:hypothetical protein
LHKPGRFACVHTDAPGFAHVELSPDRQHNPETRQRDSRDLNPLGVQDAQRRDDPGKLEHRADHRDYQCDDEAQAGNPFRRAKPAVHAAKAGRSGSPALQPSAPGKSEQTEHREQRQRDHGSNYGRHRHSRPTVRSSG